MKETVQFMNTNML